MKKIWPKLDKPLLLLVTILSIFGLVMIFSASSVSTVLRYNSDPTEFFLKQLSFLIAAYLFGFIVILRIKTKVYSRFTILIAFGGIISLLGLFVIGAINNNAQSWYDLKFFSLQPSEFVKSIIIICSATFYNMLHVNKVKSFLPHLIPVAYGVFVVILTMMQPDFGSAFIMVLITGFIFMALPYTNNYFFKILSFLLGFLVVVLIGLFLFGDNILSSNQLSRFEIDNPCSRYTEEGSGYQLCNGFIAMNNGGLTGVGLGESTQKYLYIPESHTDFIFPIIIEELGFITGIMVMIVYLLIMWRLIKISRDAANLRGSIIAYGTFILFASHIMINLLGILGLIPLTGIPLPLLSYGGSSTVNFILMTFIVQVVAVEGKTDRYKKEIKNL